MLRSFIILHYRDCRQKVVEGLWGHPHPPRRRLKRWHERSEFGCPGKVMNRRRGGTAGGTADHPRIIPRIIPRSSQDPPQDPPTASHPPSTHRINSKTQDTFHKVRPANDPSNFSKFRKTLQVSLWKCSYARGIYKNTRGATSTFNRSLARSRPEHATLLTRQASEFAPGCREPIGYPGQPSGR